MGKRGTGDCGDEAQRYNFKVRWETEVRETFAGNNKIQWDIKRMRDGQG